MLPTLLILSLFGRTLPQDSRCTGVLSTNWSCCDAEHPCIAGGGDCDRDSDCVGFFKCGNNNCRDDYSVDGSNRSSNADCCYGIAKDKRDYQIFSFHKISLNGISRYVIKIIVFYTSRSGK